MMRKKVLALLFFFFVCTLFPATQTYAATDKLIEVNTEVSDTVSGGTDYFRFTLPSPGRVRIILDRQRAWAYTVSISGSSIDRELIKTNCSNTSQWDTNNSYLLRLPAGDYTLSVYSHQYYPSSSSYNNYNILVDYTSEPASGYYEREPNNSSSTAQLIEDNIRYTGNTEISSDYDYYKVEVEKGLVQLSFDFNPNASYKYSLWSDTGRTFDEGLLASNTHNTDSFPKYSNRLRVPSGTYYLSISPNVHSDSDYYFTVNSIPEPDSAYESEVNDYDDSAQAIESGKTYIGNLNNLYDTDYYRLSLLEGSAQIQLSYDIDGEYKVEVLDSNLNPIESKNYFSSATDPDETGNYYTQKGRTLDIASGEYYVKVSSGGLFTHNDYKLSVLSDALPTYTIDATAEKGGTVTGGGEIAQNKTITLVATAKKGYIFDGWYEDGEKIKNAGANYKFTANKPRTLEARFFIAVTVSATANIGGTVKGGGVFPKDTTVTVEAKPEIDYVFSGWYENGVKITNAEEEYTFKATGNIELEARFILGYIIEVTAGNGGSVSGSDFYNKNSTVIVTAKPNTGYLFSGWYENGRKIPDAEAEYAFVATASRTLEAKFSKGYTIKTKAGNGGTAKGGGNYVADSTAKVIAQAKTGYIFIGWYESNKIVSTKMTYSFKASKARTLEAKFKKIYKITAIAGAGGTVKGGGDYVADSTVKLVAKAKKNYVFSGWYEKNKKVSKATATYSFNAKKARTLEARFKKK